MEGKNRALIFTPEKVVNLMMGIRPGLSSGDTEVVSTFTRQDVLHLLEESFRGCKFDGVRLFYAQDRCLFWHNDETSREIVDDIRERATCSVDVLNQIRMVMRDWLLEKGADVIASSQTLYPLVSENGPAGDNSTRWGAVIGSNGERACKLSLTPFIDTGVTFPIVHPNIADERFEKVRRRRAYLDPRSYSVIEACHVAFAPNMKGTKNLDEIVDELSESERIGVFIDSLKGLQHLHDLGLVYCDFKLDQILVVETDEGYVGKLADLESLRKVGFVGMMLANPYVNEDFYYSQAYQDSNLIADWTIDVERDVFSVGVALMHLLLEPKGQDAEQWIFDIANAYRAVSDLEAISMLIEEFVTHLAQWMPAKLADCIISALSNLSAVRPSLHEIMEVLAEAQAALVSA